MLELIVAATATALATGLGVIPVVALGARAEAYRPGLLGIAAGVMAVASIAGLLFPRCEQGPLLRSRPDWQLASRFS